MASGGDGPAVERLDRAAVLVALTERKFDVLVVDGGITGCGIALDAAARGLSVALSTRAQATAGTPDGT